MRAGYDTGAFGRFGIRNWDVSSLTDRRADAHRHVLYHTEFGPTWQYDWNIRENLTLKNDLTYSWTLYRGFRHGNGDRTYNWVQTEQAHERQESLPVCTQRLDARRLRHQNEILTPVAAGGSDRRDADCNVILWGQTLLAAQEIFSE